MNRDTTEHALATILTETFRTASTTDRTGFWHIYGSPSLPSFSEPLAEAVRMAAAVELIADRSRSTASFLGQNPELARAARARLSALESLNGGFNSAGKPWEPPAEPGARLEHDFSLIYAAVLKRDFATATLLLDKADSDLLEHPGVCLMYGYSLFQVGRTLEGRNRLVDSIHRLRSPAYGPASTEFWRAVSLAGDSDTEFLALLAELFWDARATTNTETAALIMLGLGQRAMKNTTPTITSATVIQSAIESLLSAPDARDSLPVEKWKAAVALYTYAADFLHRMVELETPSIRAAAGNARIQDGRIRFATGDEEAGVNAVTDGYRLTGEARKISSLQLARPADIPSIPSVQHFAVGEAFRISETPITRVDGAPIRPSSRNSVQWAAEIKDADVLAGDRHGSIFWYVATRDGWLLADGLNVHPRLHVGSGVERLSGLSPSGRVLIDRPAGKECETRLFGRHILLGGVPNYYHWLMEYVPKLSVIEALMPDATSDSSWIINDNNTPWQLESLSRLGVPLDRIVTVASGVTATCDSLIVPSMMPAADTVAFLRRMLDSDRAVTPGKKIYVSRLDADPARRRIHDEEQLAVSLQQAGFEILIPSEMSFGAQLDAFADAEVIVGPHGAGLTNLAFASRDCAVVEITNSHNHSYKFFSAITEAVGCRYTRMMSGREHANADDPENANSVVDSNHLLALIERLKTGARS
jgi:capsular polysaccharide biosynthesis protein